MRKNEWNICGYTGIQTYENPNTAMRTIKCGNELLEKIRDFYKEVLKMEFDPKKNIRGFRQQELTFSFKCGIGYDIIDEDLLDSTGTGLRRKVFEAYLNYCKNKNESWLNLLNAEIECHNSSKFSSGDFSEKIKIEKFKG